MKLLKSFAAVALIAVAHSASAAEVSLLSGIYKSESAQSGSDSAGGQTDVSVAGRVVSSLDATTDSLFEASLESTSYDAPANTTAPKSDTNFGLAGGMRWLFPNLTDKIRPYFQARAGLKIGSYGKQVTSTTTTSGTSTTVTATEQHDTKDLWYGSDIGFKMDVSKKFFFEFEIPLFASDLYSEDKQKGENGGQDYTTKHIDFYARTYSPITSMKAGIGMVL